MIKRKRQWWRTVLVVLGWLLAFAVAYVVSETWTPSTETKLIIFFLIGIATVLAEQTNHSVQSINLMFNGLQERIKALGADTHNDFRLLLRGEDTYQLLTERMAQLSYVTVIALTDENGWLVNSTNRWPVPPTDVSIRDHFQYFKNNDDRGVYISLPFVSRLNGIPTIFFNKRVNDANNEFVGIVSIGVRVSYFQHIYGSIKSLHDTSFLFLRKDGTVILR